MSLLSFETMDQTFMYLPWLNAKSREEKSKQTNKLYNKKPDKESKRMKDNTAESKQNEIPNLCAFGIVLRLLKRYKSNDQSQNGSILGNQTSGSVVVYHVARGLFFVICGFRGG